VFGLWDRETKKCIVSDMSVGEVLFGFVLNAYGRRMMDWLI
jgi:hypothetical protein